MLEVTIALKGGAVVVIDASRFIVRTNRASGKIMGYEWRVIKGDEMDRQLLYLDIDQIAAVVATRINAEGLDKDEVIALPDGGESLDEQARVREAPGT